MKQTKRIGPCMELVAMYVRLNPGCPKLHAAEFVGPHGSRRYGYRAVDRAIKAGLIVARQGKGNRYALYTGDDS